MKKVYILVLTVLLSCFTATAPWAASAPKPPTSLAADAVSSTQINLYWHDNSNDESGFKIQRKEQGRSYTLIKTVGRDTTSYKDTGLKDDTKYHYRIWAYNSVGESVYSNEASEFTLSVPDAPSNLKAVYINSSEIKLSWEDNSSDETKFCIERMISGVSWSQIGTVGANATSYSDKKFAKNMKYLYRVRAYNDNGYSEYSSTVTLVTTEAPDAPSDLKAGAVSSSQTILTWKDNSDDESYFKVERKKGAGTYSTLATVSRNVTSYTDTELEKNTQYFYRVGAYEGSGNSSYSNEISVTTPGNETTIKLAIGNTSYYVNGAQKAMDTAPFIREGRTLLPIRFITESIGANTAWNNDERKVTITLNEKTIELWIGQNYARVNGENKSIDPANTTVTPIIVEPGRTMLPLRFISENLGAKVDWDSASREVTVTYPAP